MKELHELIHSLTQAEKRYLRIFATRHVIEGETNYMKIFDAILAQEEYEEKDLEKKFAKEKFVKHLTSEKVYLFKFILKCMRVFHSEKSIETKMRDSFEEAKYLYEKQLFKPCYKQLKKLKENVIKYQDFALLFEILHLEIDLIKTLNLSNIVKDTKAIIHELEECANCIHEIHRLSIIKVKSLLPIYERNKGGISNVQEDDLFQVVTSQLDMIKEEEIKTFLGLRSFYATHYLLSYYQGQYKKSSLYSNKEYHLWEEYPHRKAENIEIYINFLDRHISNRIDTLQFQGLKEEIEQIKLIKCTNTVQEATLFILYYLSLFRLHLQMQKYEEAIALVPQIETGLVKYAQAIKVNRIITFYYNISILYFLNDHYNQSLKWFRKITDFHPKSELRMDIQDISRVLQLLNNYDCDNLDILESIIRSTKRHFAKAKTMTPMQKCIIRNMERLCNSADKEEKIGVLLQWQQEWETTLKPANEVDVPLGYNEVKYWIEKSLTGKPIAEIFRREVQLFNQREALKKDNSENVVDLQIAN